MASPAPTLTRIRFDAFELDAASGELRKSGILLKLQPQPFRVLLLLIERAGQVVTREEIQRCLWTDSTFVDFEHGINFSINQIRGALADSAENPRYVETIPRRGYRFIGAVEQPPAGSITVLKRPPEPKREKAAPRRWLTITSLLTVVVAAFVVGTYVHFRRVPALTEKDTIVLADFTNSTGDTVFDGTLRQGLSVQLEQSPFLRLISDERIHQTLRFMGQSPDAKLTLPLAREVCQRTSSAAVLEGSIASLGTEYVLGLKAENCRSGDLLAEEQVTASGKEQVLKALGEAAVELRRKLGESLSTVEKFDTPLAQATTPSLEALKAFSLGAKALDGGDYTASITAFQRAIALDPKFALAYSGLSANYGNLGEGSLALENAKKAYELRERVTEREKFAIECAYYVAVTGDLEKARQTYEIWAQAYPRDAGSHFNLANLYDNLGQYEKGLAEARESFRLSSEESLDYAYLAFSYSMLNRLEEARATAEEALAKSLDSPSLRTTMYPLAFLQNDRAGMAEQVAWAAGKPGVEDVLVVMEADTAAYFGQLGKAREFSRRSVDSAERAKKREAAASYEADAALREALFGNAGLARQRAAAALDLSRGRDVQFGVSLALAFAGRAAQAQQLAEGLVKQFPESTIVRFYYVPTVRAQVALDSNGTSKALEALQTTAPYELGAQGNGGFGISLYPVYVGGQAYLAARRGKEAAVEFQKILDHRGVVCNEAIGALAHLQIGRAYVLQGETAKARAAYQDFLTLWKDADPDIPILKEAKAEYATLN
jgi:eukaryotic-like serine/threonine-protein kinase